MTNQVISSSSPQTMTFHGCSSIDNYDFLEKLGEGTFGEVHKASCKPTSQLVALKKILLHNEEEGFPITALREIRILKELHHENIIPLLDMSVQRGDRATRKRSTMYMVTPYMDHDLTGLLENSHVKLSLPQIKCYLKQLLQGINHIHQMKYLHRDIKASNILIDNNGIVKIADFGLARQYLGDVPTEKGGAGAGKHKYTAMVVTRWYRPPELILGEARYTTAIDMWGIGCVFAEMFRRKPILQGHSDTDQGHLIFQLLGSPTEETMPGYDKLPVAEKVKFGPYKRQFEAVYKDLPEFARDLLSRLLMLNPEKRLSGLGALAHPFFYTDPPAARPQDLPKYAESHELSARKNRQNKQNVNNNNNMGSHPRPPHAPNPPHAQNAVYARGGELDNFEAGRPGSWQPGRRNYNDHGHNDYDNRRKYGYDNNRNHGYENNHHGYHNNHSQRYYSDRRGGGSGGAGNIGSDGGQNYRTYQPPVVPPYRKYNNNPVGPGSGYESHRSNHPHPPPGPPPNAPPYRRSQPPPPSHPPPDIEPPYRRGPKLQDDGESTLPPYRRPPGAGASGALNYDDDIRQ